MKNLPQEIYLQFGCTTEEMKDADFNEVAKGGAVSWCADKQFETDVRYVLAAEAEPPLSEADILAEGWEVSGIYESLTERRLDWYKMKDYRDGGYRISANNFRTRIFYGRIPNRTALKLLMRMLGIKVGA